VSLGFNLQCGIHVTCLIIFYPMHNHNNWVRITIQHKQASFWLSNVLVHINCMKKNITQLLITISTSTWNDWPRICMWFGVRCIQSKDQQRFWWISTVCIKSFYSCFNIPFLFQFLALLKLMEIPLPQSLWSKHKFAEADRTCPINCTDKRAHEEMDFYTSLCITIWS
jgi:hypothetical protein